MDKGEVEEKLKKAVRIAKINKLIQALVLIVLGLSLMIWSGTAIYVICKVISAIIAIGGLAFIVAFLFRRNNYYGSPIGLFGGVVSAVLGIYLFSNPQVLVALGPTIIGMIIIVTGIVDLTEAMRIEKQHSGGTTVALVIAAVELIIGVIFILHPDMISNILFVLMGFCLVLDGAADIWVLFQIGRPEKVVTPAEPGGEVIDGQTRPLNEAGEAKTAPSEPGFVERAKARAAARKQAKEEEKAAQTAAESAAKADTSASQTTDTAGDGYTTIPHAGGEAKDIPSASDIAEELPPQ